MFGTHAANPSGRYFAVSRFRRLVSDLMHFSARVPSVTIERRMTLPRLIACRDACNARPTWSAIFTKAFAIVAARMPHLRTAYLGLPWPRFYEHYRNIATLSIDRALADERLVLCVPVRDPELLSLAGIDGVIRTHQQKPLEELPWYRRAVTLARVPWPLRGLVWRLALDWLGPVRCRFFGTFGVTSVCAHGAGMVNLVPLLTATIHYGMFDRNGAIDMRLTFDHRVFDGVVAALALEEMEAVLNAELQCECESLAASDSIHAQATR
jgi:hypothetical protein